MFEVLVAVSVIAACIAAGWYITKREDGYYNDFYDDAVYPGEPDDADYLEDDEWEEIQRQSNEVPPYPGF